MPEVSRTDFQSELIRFRRRVATPAVDQKIRSIGSAVANVTRLAWERSLAHHDSPDEFPLPADTDCQERAFFAAFAALPKGELRRRAKDAAKLLRQPLSTRRKELGDAAELDVKSALTAVAQALSRPVPAAMRVSRTDIEAVLASHGGKRGADVPTKQPAGPPPYPVSGWSRSRSGASGTAWNPERTKSCWAASSRRSPSTLRRVT